MQSTQPQLDDMRRNRLLSLLDGGTLAALAPGMQPVALELRYVLMHEGRRIRHVHFPVEGVMSMLSASEGDRPRIEIGTVGSEGMVGLPVFLGTDVAPGECFAQVPGAGWRMAADDFRHACHAHADVADVLQRYTQALFVQVSQSTACNRLHSPLQRCARWLLMTADRVQGPSFDLTQEFLSQMLGERRPTVSRVATVLRERRMITYSRGRITIVDRERLYETACPCYGIVRDAYAQALSPRT